MRRYPQARIVLFAREPVEGRVKTRLEPVLGRQGALAMHCELTRYMIHMVGQSGLAELELSVDGNPDHGWFRQCAAELRRYAQQGDHLGERMRRAAKQVLAEREMVILLGADCVSVDADYLQSALRELEAGTDVVLGPAEDGGYVLLGLRRSDLSIFDALPWGSAEVLDLTRKKLQAQAIEWKELAPRWDVDRPADIERLSVLPDWEQLINGLRAVNG